jgi:hypothetical protein
MTPPDADLLVLPVAAGPDGPLAPPVTAAVLERLGADLGAIAGPFTGKLDDVLLVPAYGALAAPAVLLVGVGPDEGRTPETLRRAAAVAVGAAGKAATLALALHRVDPPGPPGRALAAVAEGTLLAAYRFQRHKSAPDPGLDAVTLLADGEAALAAAEPVLRRAEAGARATLAARRPCAGAGSGPCWPSAAGRPPGPGWSSCATGRLGPGGTLPWSARASPSTPAGSTSSGAPAWTA